MRRSRASFTILTLWLGLLCLAPLPAGAAAPEAVTTFESIGLSWAPGSGAKERPVAARYRVKGTQSWQRGQDLWFDARQVPSPPFREGGEYRGSIVGLQPATAYEIQLSRAGDEPVLLEAATWSERFPVGETVVLPEHSDQPLVLDTPGRPGAYRLYTAAPGHSATIDVGDRHKHGIVIKASYVILRGITLKGGRKHGVYFDRKLPVTDVVIENNDISGWGSVDASGFGFGVPYQAGIRAKNPEVHRLVIQRNRIHHPRTDSNSWCERRDGSRDPDCDTHPDGPHAVLLTDTGGNHVIRYNTVESDDEHYFADGIGGGTFSYQGFPTADSDVYGNYIERCWDNAIESEGGNRNARIWGNYIDRSYSPIAVTPVSVGPLYVWRNVIDRSRKAPPELTGNGDEDARGVFIKAGSKRWSGGRVYLYHNTVLQAAPAPGARLGLGVRDGIVTVASSGGAFNIVSRNNILQAAAAERYAIKDDSVGTGAQINDFDHDLYTGKIQSRRMQQSRGLVGRPLFAPGNGRHEYFLAANSPGVDAGLGLPGFNDGFRGAGPEIGAFETGAPAIEFGLDAYEDPDSSSSTRPPR